MTRSEKRDDLRKCVRLLKARAKYFLRMGDTESAQRALESAERFQARVKGEES